MHELIDAGLLHPLFPEALWEKSHEFDEQFFAFLEAHEPLNFYRQHGIGSSVPLYVGKASGRIFHRLRDLNLAKRDGTTWAVERKTANLYMAYLVGSICRENTGFFPITDKSDYLSGLVRAQDDIRNRLHALRYAAITQALPVPSRPVSPAELASFKDCYGEQLRRLRRHLDGQLADLAAIDDDFLRDAKIESVLQEIRDDVAVLTEQMSKRRWPRIVLVGVGGILASALTVGTAIVAGGTPLALGMGIGAGIVSMGPAGFEAADLLAAPKFDERSPLAYAALAQAL